MNVRKYRRGNQERSNTYIISKSICKNNIVYVKYKVYFGKDEKNVGESEMWEYSYLIMKVTHKNTDWSLGNEY